MSSQRQYTFDELSQYLRDSSSISVGESREVCLQASRALADVAAIQRNLTRERNEYESAALTMMALVPKDVQLAQMQKLREAYKTWREWFSLIDFNEMKRSLAANGERLLPLTVSPTERSRSVLMVHFNRGMSADEMNRLHEHLLRFGIRVEGPYRVAADKEPCDHCQQGGMYTIVVLEDGVEVGIGSSWGDKDFAEDLCDLMNMAYDFGKEAQGDLQDEQRSIDEDVQSGIDAERGG